MNDFEQDLRMVATEAVLSTDVDEAAQHIRQLANRVARTMNQQNANQQQQSKLLKEFMWEWEEEMMSDPELFKLVDERCHVLLKRYPGIGQEELWRRAVTDVREMHGTANERIIREMRQQRPGARFATDILVADGPGEDSVEEREIAADRAAAIHGMRYARRGVENKVDKERFNELELRRRQRGA